MQSPFISLGRGFELRASRRPLRNSDDINHLVDLVRKSMNDPNTFANDDDAKVKVCEALVSDAFAMLGVTKQVFPRIHHKSVTTLSRTNALLVNAVHSWGGYNKVKTLCTNLETMSITNKKDYCLPARYIIVVTAIKLVKAMADVALREAPVAWRYPRGNT